MTCIIVETVPGDERWKAAVDARFIRHYSDARHLIVELEAELDAVTAVCGDARAWTSQKFESEKPRMGLLSILVLTKFDHPITDEEDFAMARKVDPCLAARNAEWRRSYLATDRLRMICEFEAADGERVREALRSAGFGFNMAFRVERFESMA